jgi:hypothetical protein
MPILEERTHTAVQIDIETVSIYEQIKQMIATASIWMHADVIKIYYYTDTPGTISADVLNGDFYGGWRVDTSNWHYSLCAHVTTRDGVIRSTGKFDFLIPRNPV